MFNVTNGQESLIKTKKGHYILVYIVEATVPKYIKRRTTFESKMSILCSLYVHYARLCSELSDTFITLSCEVTLK